MTSPEPGLFGFAISGRIARSDIAGLCERVRSLLDGGDAAPIVCDVGGVNADAVTVDALARLQLTAWRLGSTISLRHAPSDLQELLGLMGLRDVLPLELKRDAEEWEQVRGVQEEADSDDLTI